MKIAFKIPPVTDNYSDLHLLAEVCNAEISFLIFSAEPFSLQGFYTFSFDKHITAEEYAERINRIMEKEHLLQQPFRSKNIFYNQRESVLMPSGYFSEGDKRSVCDLMFGEDKRSLCFHEDVDGNNIKNVYRVPEKVYNAMNIFFPATSFVHSTSCQLNAERQSADMLECMVYHNVIKVILFKEGKVQIVQYFEYEGPSDVSYHLLNVCERFEIAAASVQVVLSGIIDEHSNLYNEIYRYFLHVAFLSLPEGTIVAEKLNEQPQHFYSHLTALAQCV